MKRTSKKSIMNTKLPSLACLLMMSSLGICQKIQVGATIYELDPSYRYPLQQPIIPAKDRTITNLGCPKERMHPLY
jgi:hypothetical protein